MRLHSIKCNDDDDDDEQQRQIVTLFDNVPNIERARATIKYLLFRTCSIKSSCWLILDLDNLKCRFFMASVFNYIYCYFELRRSCVRTCVNSVKGRIIVDSICGTLIFCDECIIYLDSKTKVYFAHLDHII